MLAYRINNRSIKNRIYIPKYYDPELYAEIAALSNTHELLCLGDLIDGIRHREYSVCQNL